jgi:hypothetical protein
MLTLLAALSSTAAPPEVRYVQATTLNLRSAPASDAAVQVALPINARVTQIGSRDAFAQVTTASGRVGWVAGAFLADTPLTAELARQRTAEAATPAERLSWAERAVAVRPDPAALTALEQAQRAAGDAEGATRTASERRWPSAILPSSHGLEASWVGPTVTTEGPLSARAMDHLGLDTTAPWWALLDAGPPVRLRLDLAMVGALDCEGPKKAVGLTFAGEIPEGRRAVAVVRGEPLPTWSTEPPPPPVPRQRAVDAASATAERRGWASPDVGIAPLPDGWLVRVVRSQELPIPSDYPIHRVEVVELHVGVTDVTERRAWTTETIHGVDRQPIAVRDVSGDGVPELIWADQITDLAGVEIARPHHIGECDL